MRTAAVVALLAVTLHGQCGPIWAAVAPTTPDATVRCIARATNGDLLVGGWFASIGGQPMAYLARWDGSSWSAVGSVPSPVGQVLQMPNGDLVATGLWFLAGAYQSVARWDGTQWHPVYAYSPVDAMALLPNGALVLAGPAAPGNIAVATGSTWTTLGSGLRNWIWNGPIQWPSNVTVTALEVAANGDLYVGGEFNEAGGLIAQGLARWNGTAWSVVPTPFRWVQRLLVRANGELIATGVTSTGTFGIASGTAAGITAWPANSIVGGGIVLDMLELPNGDVVFAGDFTTAGTVPANRLARWNGTAWSTFGTGVSTRVYLLERDGDRVLVGGDFTAPGGGGPNLAALETLCPAAVVTVGATCSGGTALGPLEPHELPWLGTVFRAAVAGVTGPVAVEVTGLQAATVGLPGPAGCQLLISPLAQRLRLPVGGVVVTELPLPNALPFLGVSVSQQVVPLGLGANGQIAALATNALLVTIGGW